jgi:hypothetical protein
MKTLNPVEMEQVGGGLFGIKIRNPFKTLKQVGETLAAPVVNAIDAVTSSPTDALSAVTGRDFSGATFTSPLVPNLIVRAHPLSVALKFGA